MPNITVGAAATNYTLFYTSNDALAAASALANAITAAENSGALTSFQYSSGILAPQPTSGYGGVAAFAGPTNGAVFVDGADSVIIDASATGPTSIQGGAAGGAFIGGMGLAGAPINISYTNITPTGNATDYIAILDGNNYVQTNTYGAGGNYIIETGSGNDSINVLFGNSTINAGTGRNVLNFGSGNNLIYSEGFDTITGSSVGGGADTVNIGSGQTSINSGTSNFLINDTSPNPLLVTLGFGTDTINMMAGSAGATVVGISSRTTFTGVGQIVGGDVSTGDFITITGAGSATVVATNARETVNGSAATGNNSYTAGTGNDTLMADLGADTLTGASGASALALLVSGTGAGTTFAFTSGKAGGADTISGFKAADTLSFTGYGGTPLAGAVTTGGSTMVTLSDGTKLTINGVTPTTGQIKTM